MTLNRKKLIMGNEKKAPKKKRKKLALGKGIDALIPNIDTLSRSQESFFQCNIDRIRPNRYQPRRQFDRAELKELSDSIAQQGIIQPLVVRPDSNGYELIAGERRLRAARLAGLKQVPVVVRDVSEKRLLQMSIIENIQRQNLNPMEEADAYHRLMREFELTQEQVAAQIGKSRSAVANFLRLRQLPIPVKDSINHGKLTMGHARALLGAGSKAHQTLVWKTILAKGISVRQTEQMVQRLNAEQARDRGAQRKPSSEDIYFTSLAEDLSRGWGTKVLIKRRGKKGRIEIEFYDDQGLERLLERLKANH